MSGFGSDPMGSSGAGVGTPAAILRAPKRVLRKSDGTQGDAALIDPKTGDYVVDRSGQKVGCDAVEQRVYLALVTKLGSAVDQTLGIVMPGGTITPDLGQRNELAVRAALRSLTDANIIEVLSITTIPFAPTGRRVETRWRNVRTGVVTPTFV